MKKRIGWFLVVVITLSLLVAAVPQVPTTAASIPGQRPLNFVWSYPGNWQANIYTGITKMTMAFDKNVVNDAVWWSPNRYCFSLKTGSTYVPITVYRVKDTVDFSKRQYIYIKPNVRLKPYTTYVVTISPNLTAKNGVSQLGSTTGWTSKKVYFKTGRY